MTDTESEAKIELNDFCAYLPQHTYIHIPTRVMWTAASIDALIPTGKKSPPAHTWLDRNRGVELITWSPGHPMLIENQYVLDGG